ncbi:polygalacturonase isoform X2 [Diabrotica virgifera virgifera]|uniref:endo-polygalacturonase n=1 Tax=Diabrotica virgifera virgifera TaxID=50390 RepID=A0ABM5JZ08_DIAVI|nr:polygalacturonase isoform X2 [Diabrotica virgifera virgifera]
MCYFNKFSLLLLLYSPLLSKSDPCTVTQFSQVAQAVNDCTNLIISNLVVPGGQTLELHLKYGATVTFEGTTVFEVAHWEGPLIEFTGEKVLVQGASGETAAFSIFIEDPLISPRIWISFSSNLHKYVIIGGDFNICQLENLSSILNAQGEKYWDGHGGSGGVTKPRFVQISTTGGSVFKNIHLKNCALFCVGIRASDLTISGWNIDSHEGRKKGKNTDGFGIAAGNNIHIENSSVDNQDDCIVVNGGTNMVFNGIKCTGSHGLSFSAGSNTNDHAKYATINNITFSNCELKDGAIGIHVKTKRGTGLITNVTYDHITMTGMQKDGIYINQDYGDVGNTTRDFQITNLKVSNVEGSIHGKGARAVHIVCNDKKCANWQWSNIDISGGAKDYCNFHPTGFDC